MKAIILSAGRGERLRPLTDHTPKPLLKAGGLCLIEHIIHALVLAGVDTIVVNTAHLSEQFPKLLGSGQRYGVTIHYSPEQEGGLETAGGIINALPLLGDEPFLVVNGDIWTDYPFKQLISMTLEQDIKCHLVLVDNPAHHPQGDFAITNGLLHTEGAVKYTYSGIGLYHPALFSDLEPQRLALKPLLLSAMAQQQISAEYYSGQWSDIGTVERLNSLNKQLSSL